MYSTVTRRPGVNFINRWTKKNNLREPTALLFGFRINVGIFTHNFYDYAYEIVRNTRN